jgi:asparagine synthetase B (glutamine-hydrolysing)
MTFCRSPFELSALELASGLVFGSERCASRESSGATAEPLVALEEALLPALDRGPCLVSFSGGRDSSAVLAVATAAARREGLPLPVPVTNVFPEVERSAETEWQELVVEHLRLDNWVRIELTEELDCVGPIARAILERHGLLWPFNAHFHWPLLDAARGGTLLTGIGGDELLGTSEWARAAAVLSGATRPTLRDIPRAVVAVAPYRLRRAVMRRRHGVEARLPWLTDPANDELGRLHANGVASEPLRWSGRRRWWHERRETEVGLRSLELIAADCHTTIAHPLTDAAFAASVARLAARKKLHDRTSLLEAIFSPLLPPSLLERTSKAAFGPVFWGAASRSLAREAVEELGELEPVDGTALRDIWSGEAPDAHSFLLLQAALVRGSTEQT